MQNQYNEALWDTSLKNSSKPELISLDKTLEAYLPPEELKEVKRILYGDPVLNINISEEAQNIAKKYNFEIQGFKIPAKIEQLRKPRIVRVGAVQHTIKKPTTDLVQDQADALRKWMKNVVEAAHLCGVNILCTQELWTSPFFPCTREMHPWLEFSENIENGFTTKLFMELAKQYNMVIINSILERDKNTDVINNAVALIDNTGKFFGKHHKNHIPRVGDFNESTYYMEGNTGHPVFETQFGKIGINICYGRHFPTNWMMFALNGAEIIFNPSATVGSLSEPLWGIEARNAAIANHCYTVGINRVGTEVFPNEFTSGDGQKAHKDFGMFYGSSYVTAPNGSRTPSLSRTQDGLLITELDLNLCRQVADTWKFRTCGRWDLYEKSLKKYNDDDFKPQVINKVEYSIQKKVDF